ncbi:MAG: hypothetical protein ACI87N_003376 [Flavobacteriales bacterium]|jgi:hypothetical protein
MKQRENMTLQFHNRKKTTNVPFVVVIEIDIRRTKFLIKQQINI